jgi:hypothetical protein
LFIGMIRFPDQLDGNGARARCATNPLEKASRTNEMSANFAVFWWHSGYAAANFTEISRFAYALPM